MNVLSLFDGMSCGQIALQRAGIQVDNYFASEIDKHAIKVTQDNFPNTIQLGDVTKLNLKELPKIDILHGGSPCQGFSRLGKRLNFKDPRSRLFFEFVKIKNELKPTYFLLENVMMKPEWQDVITKYLGVEPIFINSRLVSAQDRKRLYWTNIPIEGLPEDKNISWSDISEDGWFAGGMRGRRVNERGVRDDYNKNLKIVQYIESRKDNKTNCLTTVGKDNVATKEQVGRTSIKDIEYRNFTRTELEKLQTLPVGYTKSVSYSQANRMIGNGWTVDIVSWIFSFVK